MAMDTYDRRLAPGGIPQVSPSQPAPVGRALTAIAGGLQDAAAGAEYRDAVKLQKDEEDAAAWAAKTLAETKLAWTTKLQVEQQQAEPGAYGFTGTITAEYDKQVDKLMEGAPSDKARTYLDLRLTDFKTALVSDAFAFEAASRIDKRMADTRSAINLNRNTVSTDPSQFAALLGDTVAIINTLDIPTHKKQVLVEEAQKGLAFSAVQGSLAKAPATTVAELQSGKWDALLDADNKQALINQGETEIRRAEAEAKAARNEAIATYVTDLSDHMAQVAAGYGQADPAFSPARIRKVVGGERGDRLAHAAETAQATGLMRTEIATATPEELQRMQADLEAGLSGPVAGFRDKAQQYDTFAGLVDHRNREIAADSAGYAVRNFPTVRGAQAELSKLLADPKADPKALRAAARQYAIKVDEAQATLGVDPAEQRLLGAGYAAQLASAFGGPNAKVDDALAQSQRLASAFGEDWPRVARELGDKLPDWTNTTIAMDTPDQANDVRFVAQAATELKDTKAALGQVVKESDVDKALDDALEAARASISAAGAGGEATFGQLYETTKAATYKLIAGGMDTEDAAAQAAAMTFGKKYATANALRFPRSFDPGAIESGALNQLARIGELPVDLPVSLAGLPEADARTAFVTSLQDGGRWITSQDESGAQLLDALGDPVTVGGQPLIVPWSELVAVKRPSRPGVDRDLNKPGVQ